MFFQTVFVAILALMLGLVVCFAGFRLFVILLPIWAFFAGFLATAQSIAQLFGGGFLATLSGWVFGFVVGLFFALASYFFYYAAIVLLAATVGYEIGAGVMATLSINSGFLQFIVGLALAVVFTVGVIVLGIPKVFIVVLTALGGAAMVLAGVLLAIGRIPLTALGRGLVGAFVHDSWFWALAYIAIVALGIVVQMILPAAYTLKPYGEEQPSLQAPETPPAARPRERVPATTPTSAGPQLPAV